MLPPSAAWIWDANLWDAQTLATDQQPFRDADVGSLLLVTSPAGESHRTTVAGVEEGRATLAEPAPFTGPSCQALWGADAGEALQAGIDRQRGGGGLVLPPGIFLFDQPLDLAGARGLTLRGAGRASLDPDTGTLAATSLVYLGAGDADAVQADGSAGLTLRDLGLYYAHGAFTGTLLSLRGYAQGLGDSAKGLLEGCVFSGLGVNGAQALVSLRNGIIHKIHDCSLTWAQVGVSGTDGGRGYSVSAQIQGCTFKNTRTGIADAGQNFTLEDNCFEYISTRPGAGMLYAYRDTNDLGGPVALAFSRNWCGDVSSEGPLCHLVLCNQAAFSVTSNTFGETHTGWAIRFATAPRGGSIIGNAFGDDGEPDGLIDLGNWPGQAAGVVVCANTFSQATRRPVAVTLPGGITDLAVFANQSPGSPPLQPSMLLGDPSGSPTRFSQVALGSGRTPAGRDFLWLTDSLYGPQKPEKATPGEPRGCGLYSGDGGFPKVRLGNGRIARLLFAMEPEP